MHGADSTAVPPAPRARRDRARVAGSTLVGAPALSTDPTSQVVQAGWVEGGRRYGVFLRGRWRSDNGRPATDDPRGWLDAFSYDASSGVVTRMTFQRTPAGPLDIRRLAGGTDAPVDAAALAWASRFVDHVNELQLP
jgi:hypothetical protein